MMPERDPDSHEPEEPDGSDDEAYEPLELDKLTEADEEQRRPHESE